jgi:Terpene synthase family 2, C-terminal metal binding
MSTPIPADGYPPAGRCAPVVALGLEILADLRNWAARHPDCLSSTPMEAMAMSAAFISPWRTARELRPAARLFIWTYALDDHVDQHIATRRELDDLLDACIAVTRGSHPANGHPLVAALAEWQDDVSRQPLYPALARLWTEKFGKTMDGMRYDWIAAQSRSSGHRPSDVQEYLEISTDGVTMWIVHIPRWASYPHDDLIDALDVLVSALDDIAVVVRLANDLVSADRELSETSPNNILMYGVSEDWVRAELARYAQSARDTLAPLLATGFPPAVELHRQLDWTIGFYARADFRGWGSDAPVVPEPVRTP